jgi:flagellar basal-body rod modification protein FlgD
MTSVQTNYAMPDDLLTAMNPGKKASAPQSTADAAQDKFLTLLVTQMRNQDPLNPMDNAQVTSQLAQLSTVTGIEKMNDTLKGLQGSYQASQTLQAVGMIGRGVFAPGSHLALADGKALYGVELAEPADNVKLTIRDDKGAVMRTYELGGLEAGSHPLHWDGKTDKGTTAEDGIYSFEVTATRGADRVPVTNLAFGDVASVTTGAQGVKLTVIGIGDVNLAEVRQII